MKIQVFPNYENLSQHAAEEIFRTIELKPNAVICLASGHSPLRACAIFVQLALQKNLDISKTVFIGLDEWVGVNPQDPGSGESFLKKNIVVPLRISKSNYHLFNAAANDLQVECTNMDQVIANLGGIDLMVVGIGINGHIGFNEPGVSFDLKSHVIELTKTTIDVGQKYFAERQELKTGITLGLAHVMDARSVVLVADGAKKTAIVAKAFNGSVSREVPASILLNHHHCLVMLDQDAAAGLKVGFETF